METNHSAYWSDPSRLSSSDEEDDIDYRYTYSTSQVWTPTHSREVLRGMGEVRALEERSLTGTWDIADLQRWKWKASEDPGRGESVGVKRSSVGVRGEFNVTISPKEIRTFFVYFKLK
ncbi:epididymis-specific alpha-mannosidase-like [Salvelinus alpinus]|uniref:epididymis-specific alpha-mannosidase-like n=1 Tax=Salvelinus alpinus TaxID=8036 RepID=UPI0039FCB653